MHSPRRVPGSKGAFARCPEGFLQDQGHGQISLHSVHCPQLGDKASPLGSDLPSSLFYTEGRCRDFRHLEGRCALVPSRVLSPGEVLLQGSGRKGSSGAQAQKRRPWGLWAAGVGPPCSPGGRPGPPQLLLTPHVPCPSAWAGPTPGLPGVPHTSPETALGGSCSPAARAPRCVPASPWLFHEARNESLYVLLQAEGRHKHIPAGASNLTRNVLGIHRPVITESRPAPGSGDCCAFSGLWPKVSLGAGGVGDGTLGLWVVLTARLERVGLGNQTAGTTVCPSCFREGPYKTLCKACPGGLWHLVEDGGSD